MSFLSSRMSINEFDNKVLLNQNQSIKHRVLKISDSTFFQFEMTKITSGEKSGIETVKLFAMPSGGSNKAISITEVSCFKEIIV